MRKIPMGSNRSQIRNVPENGDKPETEINQKNFTSFRFPIPDDLLIVILSFVPASDLLKNCRLVCQEWKDVIDSHGLWKMKCDRDKEKVIPRFRFKELPRDFYRLIYLCNPYGRNLIKNPQGKDGMKEWVVECNSGDGFVIENPPKGCDPVPVEVGLQFCFATSFGICKKHQMIDLLREGINEEVLDCGNAVINISEWYAARFDCGSVYELKVSLLDENLDEIDQFSFEYTEEQWLGSRWSKVEHTFNDVVGVRYVLFDHSGQDSQFWAGHYGSKMAGSLVRLTFR